MELYDYQKKVIECCENDPSHSQLISMPTGTGKTITFLSLARKFNKKTLIIVHREELLKQTYEKAKLCGYAENEVSLIFSEDKQEIKLLTISMVQSLNRNLGKYKPEDVEMIVVDEAHHATASSYKKIFDYFQVFEKLKSLFGFTATPLRGDKDLLSSIFFSHSFKMTLEEATQEGFIVPVSGIRVQVEKSFKDIDTKQGDYDISQLDKVMNCDSMNDLVVEKCKYLNKTPGIIFCTSVNHAEELASRLRKEKRKSISISHKTSKRTCAIIYRMLKDGRIDFITNAIKLSEGFDYPPIQSVILARPTRSPVLYKQMIGRGLRNSEGKLDCHVLEFTSNDEKMMKWEDIDNNATFQAISIENRKTREQAKDKYRQIFNNSNVEILDVRISPFDFYECKVRRILKYKNFYYVPFSYGFFLCEIREGSKYNKSWGKLFDVYGSMFFWEKEYKSFYPWGEPNYKMNGFQPQIMESILLRFPLYAKVNNLGKWYPSETQKPTRKHKLLAQEFGLNPNKLTSARHAEMEIEKKSIQMAIDKFPAKKIFSGIMKIL